MMGAAMCVFYLLLLALAEHLGFGAAYLAAAVATVGLIGGYSATVLRTRKRTAVLTTALAGLYGVLYVLVQLQSYALLVGSVGLFAALAVAMVLTRRVDWYALGRRATEPSAPGSGGGEVPQAG
jgi:inner membrane protein